MKKYNKVIVESNKWMGQDLNEEDAGYKTYEEKDAQVAQLNEYLEMGIRMFKEIGEEFQRRELKSKEEWDRPGKFNFVHHQYEALVKWLKSRRGDTWK